MPSAAPTKNTDLVLVGPVKMGRPSSYTDETAQEICERLVEGESLLSIVADDHMPGLTTVYQWMDKNPDFAKSYAQARARQATTFADKMQDIANDLRILPEHKRLMLDTLKWRAARQNWRAWGDKVSHEHAIEVHSAHAAESLPPGLEWLAGRLHGPNAADRSEPDPGAMGEG